MISDDPDMLLFIEPQKQCSAVPTIDELTKFFGPIFQNRTSDGRYFRGVHYANCGETSSNCNYCVILDGKEYMTNSLALHYLMYHRDEVPKSEIDKIQNAMIKSQEK